MHFRDLYNKYKILAFVIYALPLTVALVFLGSLLIKILLALPLLVLGGFILFDIFPRKGDGYISAVKADGKGEIHVTSKAVIRAVRTACKEIKDIRYYSCTASGGGSEGVTIRLCIKVVNTKVLEISDLTREFVKELLEGELNVLVGKIDIVVENTAYVLTVKKVVEERHEEVKKTERKAVYTEDSPSYIFRYGSSHKVFKVPAHYIEEDAEGGVQERSGELPRAEERQDEEKTESVKTIKIEETEIIEKQEALEQEEVLEQEEDIDTAPEQSEQDEDEEEFDAQAHQEKFSEWLTKQEQRKQESESHVENEEEHEEDK